MHYLYMAFCHLWSPYLLSVVIRLKDVADGDRSSVDLPAGRVQHEAEQALVLLMRSAHYHAVQRELWRNKYSEINTISDLRYSFK